MRRALSMLGMPLVLGGCILYENRVEYTEPARNPVTVGQIIAMSRGGVRESTIIAEIEVHGLAARPTADEVLEMKNAGVSDPVIEAAVQTPVRMPGPGRVIYERTVHHRHDEGLIFGLGALFGYALGHGRAHVHVRGCGHAGW